jgi:hypothetical protein
VWDVKSEERKHKDPDELTKFGVTAVWILSATSVSLDSMGELITAVGLVAMLVLWIPRIQALEGCRSGVRGEFWSDECACEDSHGR